MYTRADYIDHPLLPEPPPSLGSRGEMRRNPAGAFCSISSVGNYCLVSFASTLVSKVLISRLASLRPEVPSAAELLCRTDPPTIPSSIHLPLKTQYVTYHSEWYAKAINVSQEEGRCMTSAGQTGVQNRSADTTYRYSPSAEGPLCAASKSCVGVLESVSSGWRLLPPPLPKNLGG